MEVAADHKIKLHVIEPEDAEDEKWTYFTGISRSTKSSNSSMMGQCGDRLKTKYNIVKDVEFTNFVHKNYKPESQCELPDINLGSRACKSAANNKNYWSDWILNYT